MSNKCEAKLICGNCKIDKLITDFINSKNICYKCMYRKKMENIIEKQTKKTQLCRTCGNRILHKKEEKKRQRTVFCSKECAEKGHKEQLTNHWTRKIRSESSHP